VSKYHRHRFAIEVVEQCVWLYYRFSLSYRNIEEMLAKRGVQVSYETIRAWCHKFGSLYTALLRKQPSRIGSKWHLDEVFIKINGVRHYLWRAVDQNGVVIDILVQPRRDRGGSLALLPPVATYGAKSTACHRDRQIAELLGGEEVDLTRRHSSPESLSEQSSREFASTNPHA
jgi:putative transposase